MFITSYNQVAACEWLMSDRRPNSDDLKYGLKENSPVYKAIMADATIQLGLMKPRILFSFMHLLEEPNSMGRWLNDAECSPVLSQIFRIFHSEKHAVFEDDGGGKEVDQQSCQSFEIETDV